MKLEKKQREKLLMWVAEGLQSDEINKRAAKFKPPFVVTRQHVDYYRKTRKIDIEEIKQVDETTALTSGLALKEKRVGTLQQLADLMLEDLLNGKLWTDQVKGIGGAENFERVEYKEFNGAEVAQVRGVLDDIAKELGHRGPDTKIENNFNFDMNTWKDKTAERLKQVQEIEE